MQIELPVAYFNTTEFSTRRPNTISVFWSQVPSLLFITGFWKLFSCKYNANSFLFLKSKSVAIEGSAYLTGIGNYFKKSLREFPRFQTRKHTLLFLYGIVYQKIVLNKTEFFGPGKTDHPRNNKMCHNNLRFTIPSPDLLLPLAILKAETNKANPFSISSWNCLGCDKTLRNSFVIMVLHFIGTSPEELVNGCFQIHRAIKG